MFNHRLLFFFFTGSIVGMKSPHDILHAQPAIGSNKMLYPMAMPLRGQINRQVIHFIQYAAGMTQVVKVQGFADARLSSGNPDSFGNGRIAVADNLKPAVSVLLNAAFRNPERIARSPGRMGIQPFQQ